MPIQYDYGDQYPPDPPEDEWGNLQEEDGERVDPLTSLQAVMIPVAEKLKEDMRAITKAFEPIGEAARENERRRLAAYEAAARRRDERARHWNR